MLKSLVYIMKGNILLVIILIVCVILALLYSQTLEGLSLSQFPIPTCATNNSATFYTCNGCGMYFQEQNKIGQACDCGGIVAYPTKIQPSCYKQTLLGRPDVGQLQTCTETFQGPQMPGSCTSCDSSEITCVDPGSTFESGSQERRNLPCPVPFPPVGLDVQVVSHKQVMHMSELDVYKHLQNGGILVAANKGSVINYALQKLQEQTLRGGQSGYPDFYYIEGPILVMTRVNDVFYWMIDYPIKYNPGNYLNYVNKSNNWAVAKTMYNAGKRLLNSNAPVVLLSPGTYSDSRVVAASAACMPQGWSQSNTDVYYPGCNQKSCLWGPDYGSGNWLYRV